MNGKRRLELAWIGKDERPKVEPRILLDDLELSYHASHREEHDIFDNWLVFGDNLLATKGIQQQLCGAIKCMYIDPPYNSGSAFAHYDDSLEHSLWLSLMKAHIETLAPLLSDDGVLWISIDDNEGHYLKVLCDEILGRRNFICNVVWQKAYTANQTAKNISDVHDHIFAYARDAAVFKMGKISRTNDQRDKFKNPDGDQRGPWKPENLSAGKYYAAGQFPITGPNGDQFYPPKGRYWRCNEDQYKRWLDEDRITFGIKGTGRPMLKKFLAEMDDGLTATTWWPHEEVGTNKQASIDLKNLLPAADVFQNPKPEQLIRRIIELSTDRGDVVLDTFAGSGTTGAVAHKMGRRWIMVELGEHCHTHIIPRLKKVIDGEDPAGVTEAVGWRGGGGFRYYRLAPSLLEKDRWGNWVINPSYNAAMLAEAVCKLMGFTYAPDDTHYWMHGRSSEGDFIYVTTQSLTHDQLRAISEEVGETRTLLICCKAFRANIDAFPNLTVSKIPPAVLRKCEWGKDDYSLSVARLVSAEPEPDAGPEPPTAAAPAEKPPQTDLFVAAGK